MAKNRDFTGETGFLLFRISLKARDEKHFAYGAKGSEKALFSVRRL